MPIRTRPLVSSEDDDGADHRPPYRALAAGERNAAEHDRGQRLELPADAGRGIRACLPRSIEDAAGGAERARQRVGRKQHPLHADSGMARRLAARADRREVPAVTRPARKMCPMSSTTISAAALIGMPSTQPSPRKSQASLSTELVANTVAYFLAQNVDRGAQDDQRHQRGQERTRLDDSRSRCR